MNASDIRRIIPSLPEEVRTRVKTLCDKYEETKNQEYVKLMLEILEQFDDKREVLDLVKRMK